MRMLFVFLSVSIALSTIANVIDGTQAILAGVSILFSLAAIIQAARIAIGTRAGKDMW